MGIFSRKKSESDQPHSRPVSVPPRPASVPPRPASVPQSASSGQSRHGDPNSFWGSAQPQSEEFDYGEAALKVLRWVGRPLDHNELVRLIMSGAPKDLFMFYWGDGEQAKKPINLSIAASIVGLSAADDDRYPIVREGGLYRLRDAPDAGLPLPGKATAVAAGNGGFALMTDGTVFGWKNWSTKFHIPAGLRGVSAIQAVMDSGVALTDEGTAVSLTSGNLIEDLTEVVAVSICQGYYGGFLALKRDGTVTKSGLAVVELPNGLSDVVAIAAGKSHFLALIGDGTVVAWGQNDYGQTTVPTGLTNVTAIAAGYNHSLALRNDGTVVAWGSNETGSSYSSSYCGQSEVPSGLSNVTAISAGHSHSLALRSDGTVSQWGGDGAPPSWLCDVKAIAGGSASSLALRRDGSVVGWGSGY